MPTESSNMPTFDQACLSSIAVQKQAIADTAGSPFLCEEMFNERLRLLKQTRIKVLGGYVMLRDVMGQDRDIAEAARVTAQSEGRQLGDDAHLIRYLMRHHHTTPLEMVELKFEVMVAMDTWRQWIR
jgi:thymidylate synthase ThyX